MKIGPALVLYSLAMKAGGRDEVHWSSVFAQYFWSPSGKPLFLEDVTANLEMYNQNVRQDVHDISIALGKEQMPLYKFHTQMNQMLTDTHVINYMVGRGGIEAMTQKDWLDVQDEIYGQLTYLDKFAASIGRGELSPGQITARANMYGKSSWISYQKGMKAANKQAGATEERRLSAGDEKVCGDCRNYEAAGWKPLGTLPAPGEQCSCMSNCRCSFEFRGGGLGDIPPGMGDPDNFVRQDWLVSEQVEFYGHSYDVFTTEAAIQQKQRIATELAKRTGEDYDQISRFIHQWAMTSNDNDWASLHIQKMAAEEFGVPLSQWQKDKIAHMNIDLNPHLVDQQLFNDETTKKILRAMYDNTQEELARAGIQSIRLYRGITDYDRDRWAPIDIGDTIAMDSNTLESWSLKKGVAAIFGNRHVYAEVAAEDIIGTCRTGFGCLSEWEFVVKGSTREVVVWNR